MSKKTDPTLADMAVRVARAEMERDAAFNREALALASRDQVVQAYRAITSQDKEKILEIVEIIGIPARDLRDIYQIENVWRKETGGNGQALLEWARARSVDAGAILTT